MNALTSRLGDEWSAFARDQRAALAERQSMAQEKDRDISKLQVRIGQAKADERTALQQQLQAAQADRSALTTEMQALETAIRTETERRAEEPHTRLAELKEEALTLLNRSSALERELTEKEVLREAVNAETGQRLDDFTTAETVHRRQATVMLFAMLGILLLTGVVIYLLFLSQRMGVSQIPVDAGRWSAIEQIALVGVGRLAILFFAAWGLKYTGSLHRQHAEQAVIYCDRRAALGVMRTILEATPSVEQRREVLKLLAESYLNFEQSAFRTKPGDVDSKSDGEVRAVQQAVDTLRPVVEVLKGLLDKAK